MNNYLICCYCRVSTREQTDNHSISYQIKKTNEFALKNFGRDVDKIYLDEGYSGKDIDGRPGMIKLLSELRKDNIYIFTSVSRLGRDTECNLQIVRRIREAGASARIIELDGLDLTDPIGQAIFGLISTVGAMERQMINIRTREVTEKLKKDGKLLTKPPYGYKIERSELGKKYNRIVPNEDEQEVIEMMRTMVRENPFITTNGICKILTERGIKMRKSKIIHRKIVNDVLIREGIRKPKLVFND